MNEATKAAQTLGRLGRGIKKTMTHHAIEQRKHAALKSAIARGKRKHAAKLKKNSEKR